jgi:hypothetical protein
MSVWLLENLTKGKKKRTEKQHASFGAWRGVGGVCKDPKRGSPGRIGRVFHIRYAFDV